MKLKLTDARGVKHVITCDSVSHQDNGWVSARRDAAEGGAQHVVATVSPFGVVLYVER